MKKVIIAAVIAVAGSTAVADVLLPDTVSFSGEAAQTVFTQIVHVTGRTPTSFRGREIVNARAELSCSRVGEQYACTVLIQK